MFDRHIPRRGPAPQVMTGGDGSGTKGSRTYSVAFDVGIVSSTWECDYPHSDSTWPPSRSYWRKILCRIARDAVDRGRTGPPCASISSALRRLALRAVHRRGAPLLGSDVDPGRQPQSSELGWDVGHSVAAIARRPPRLTVANTLSTTVATLIRVGIGPGTPRLLESQLVPPENFNAFVATAHDGATERGVRTVSQTDLPPDGVLISVEWSSVNYKDALATTATGKVAKISPLIPGIDLAGTVVDGGGDQLPPGTAVLAHGYDLGVARHGGYAELARVPPEWLVRLPTGLDARQAMVIGTAGFTAALSVAALEERGLVPGDGPVLVTGATGGVGSVAVSILAVRGYDVVASTGKPDSEPYLRSLGAAAVIPRSTLSVEGTRPLEATTWAGAVDCVGGLTLASVLARLRYGGAVAASGLTGGAALPTTVLPFILRGVALLGIDSVQTPIERRRAIWQRLGDDLKPDNLDAIAQDVALSEVPGVLDAILRGGVTGRHVVDVHR